MNDSSSERSIDIIYDGECPVCSTYTTHLRLRQTFGVVNLVNARDNPNIVAEFIDLGIDLNEGMAVKVGNEIYFADEAIHVLALMSTDSGFFNRLNSTIFRSRTISKLLYPLMRLGRNTLLRLLRRSKI